MLLRKTTEMFFFYRYSLVYNSPVSMDQFNGLVQERRNSIAKALELRLSCANPSN